MLVVDDGNIHKISIHQEDSLVVISIDGEEVFYIDHDGINLLSDCSKKLGVPLDKKGCIKVNRP